MASKYLDLVVKSAYRGDMQGKAKHPASKHDPVYPSTLMGQFKRHFWAFATGALMLALFQWSMNRIDWAGKRAIDGLFSSSEPIGKTVLLIFFLALFAFCVRVASRWFMFNSGRNVEYELRAMLLSKLHTLGSAFYRKVPVGDIMSRATSDLMQVRLLFGFGALNLVNVVFAFLSALQVLLAISLRLTLISFLTLPLVILSTRYASKSMFKYTKSNQEALGKLSEVVQTSLSGLRVVRSFALEEFELQRFQQRNKEYLSASLNLARVRGLFAPLAGAISALGTLTLFWYGGSLLQRSPENGGISKGDFFAFWMAYGRMTWPMIALGFSLSILSRGRAGYARLKEIFDAQPEVVSGHLQALNLVNGDLRVRGLSFKYGEREVLFNVSFDLKEGCSLAIMGRTGSGKSTLASLLARLYPTPKSTVFLDGVDVCDLPLSVVRENIGYAQQDAFLFSTTIARNISFALDDQDGHDVQKLVGHAASEAHIWEETMALPEQFDTIVGERGVQLSGGQRQRIALARALLRKPKILVLDDPLSAVDTKTEAAILGAIDRQKKERTLLLVTHRVSAAMRCDRILVLERGRIVQDGTHDELKTQEGLYKIFVEEQAVKAAMDELARSA